MTQNYFDSMTSWVQLRWINFFNNTNLVFFESNKEHILVGADESLGYIIHKTASNWGSAVTSAMDQLFSGHFI